MLPRKLRMWPRRHARLSPRARNDAESGAGAAGTARAKPVDMNASPTTFNSPRFRMNVILWSRPYPIRTLQRELARSADDDANLYLVVRRRGTRDTVVYVGMTYDQTVSKRFVRHDVLQRLYLDGVDDDVFVVTGRLATRRTRDEVAAVEALLIYRLDPKYNRQGRNEYQANSLVVVNVNAGKVVRETYAGSSAASNRFRFWGGMKKARQAARRAAA